MICINFLNFIMFLRDIPPHIQLEKLIYWLYVITDVDTSVIPKKQILPVGISLSCVW